MADAVARLAANRNDLARLGTQARADAIRMLQELDYLERLRGYLNKIPLPSPAPSLPT